MCALTYSLFDAREKFYSDANSIFDINFDDLFLVGAKGRVIASRSHTDSLCVGDSFYDTLSDTERDFLIPQLNSYDRHLILLKSSLGFCFVIPSMFPSIRTFLVSVTSFSFDELLPLTKSGFLGLVRLSPDSEVCGQKEGDSGKIGEDLERYAFRLRNAYGTHNYEYLAKRSFFEAAEILGEKSLDICRYIGCICRIELGKSLSHALPRERIDAYAALGFVGAMAMLLRNASDGRDMTLSFDECSEGLTVSVSARLHTSLANASIPIFTQFSNIAARMGVLFEQHEERDRDDLILSAKFCPMKKDFSLLGNKVEPDFVQTPDYEDVY